ncbi:uncharacterized protein SOCE26_076500 [Sorangium cellulosum]|uniref:Uncharacterized protein n=1 Tax=Sorangium cellulosum TaxID=56 RepID=A0A2L0F3K1_SORCE|nr:hypothetical protein [Sorangium cellulosum]AUX46145.1 uncharacterized protein SOCE26_076500 [Sorangium cellulosum]
MLQKPIEGACFLCEASAARWNDPAAAGDPGKAGHETEALARRIDELRSGQSTPEELRSHLLQMCAMCQKVLMDVGEGATREDIISRLEYRVARLGEVASAEAGAAT